jgi:hypothetical protein
MALRLVGVVSESVAQSEMVAAAALGVLGFAAGSFAAAGKAAVDFVLSEEDAPVANRAGVRALLRLLCQSMSHARASSSLRLRS